MEMSMVVWLLVAALAAVFFLQAEVTSSFLLLYSSSGCGRITKGNFLSLMNAGRTGSATGSATVNNLSAQKVYTKSEVAWHNKRTDCWIIIKDKVYDVTSYVEEHPGGDSILAHAGDDSTKGFYGPQHATRVFDMVDEFYIGDLKQ